MFVLDFQENEKAGLEFPNFNFNVSHHGDYVAIASEPLCLVGLDIVSYVIPPKETVLEFIQNFSSYFSSLEWDNIINAGSCDGILVEFYRYNCTSFIGCFLSAKPLSQLEGVQFNIFSKESVIQSHFHDIFC